MKITTLIALGGWLVALTQLVLNHINTTKWKNAELLEKTLGYFERGTQARSVGISLVRGIWLKQKKELDIITPVLVSQLVFLLKDAEDFGQEQRNVVRLIFLLKDCLPHIKDSMEEFEAREAIRSVYKKPGKIHFEKETLKIWYKMFNGDDAFLESDKNEKDS